jgi:hypothetical protein
MNFSKNIFPAFGLHEKITKCENQSLANAPEIRQRPVVVAGFRRASLVGSGHILSDPAHLGRIPTVLARFDRIRGRISAILVRSGQLLTMAGIRQYSG